MSGWAVKNDGTGFRAVNLPTDCLSTETYTTTQPVLTIPPQPDAAGFQQAVKTGLGGILAANTLSVSYPLFFAAIQTQVWADVQTMVLDAQAKALINTTQYTAIKAAATQFNIPITLP